jgi:ABC-2 type transport system permease protein
VGLPDHDRPPLGPRRANDVGPSNAARGTLEYQLRLADLAAIAALLALVLGITVVTTEFRHGTITPTSLVEPRRERVIVAKAFAAGVVGLGFAVLAIAVIAAVAGVWLAAVGAEVHLLEGEALKRAAQTLLAVVLWALMGVAIGAMVQSQVSALVGTLIWLFMGEGIVWALLGLVDVDGLAAYLPFRALGSADGARDEEMLSYAAGVAVSLAWIAVIGAAGIANTRRRDLT